jgi:hypothetical protein
VTIVKIIATLAVAVLLFFVSPQVLPASEYGEVSGLIQKGLDRREIVKILGEPVERWITAKTNRYI